MFMKLIEERRSIRVYEDRAVEVEKVRVLVEAALRAPSSRSLNPWEFIIVDDRKKLEALSRCKPHGASFLKDAPLAICVLADPERCDVWVEDCSIASVFIQLAAQSIGLSSCWIQIRKRDNEDGRPAGDHVKELLKVPDHLEVSAIISVGYPGQVLEGHDRNTLAFEKISHGLYGTPARLS